jgi:hypothetical protein
VPQGEVRAKLDRDGRGNSSSSSGGGLLVAVAGEETGPIEREKGAEGAADRLCGLMGSRGEAVEAVSDFARGEEDKVKRCLEEEDV